MVHFETFEQMPYAHQIGLIFHEIVYALLRPIQKGLYFAQDSFTARQVNSLLFHPLIYRHLRSFAADGVPMLSIYKNEPRGACGDRDLIYGFVKNETHSIEFRAGAFISYREKFWLTGDEANATESSGCLGIPLGHQEIGTVADHWCEVSEDLNEPVRVEKKSGLNYRKLIFRFSWIQTAEGPAQVLQPEIQDEARLDGRRTYQYDLQDFGSCKAKMIEDYEYYMKWVQPFLP